VSGRAGRAAGIVLVMPATKPVSSTPAVDAGAALPDEPAAREPVLDTVDRVSEMLFGLFMAVTFVGALSVAESGRTEVKEMFIAAFGCNLAWGLVDAVMYLVRTVTARGRSLALVHAVRKASDPAAGRALIHASLSRVASGLVSDAEVEAMRKRVVSLAAVPARPTLNRDDWLASLGVFLIVVGATFPVVIPFAVIGDVGTAKLVSRIVTLAMLFVGGLALGRHAGYGSWKVGFMMTALGVVVIAAIMALGG